jgi:hypothetical protein
MGTLLRAFAVLAAVCCLSGCFFGEDYGTPGMTISNETSEPVDVFYRRQMGPTPNVVEDLVVEIGPNRSLSVIGLHQTEGPCLRGTLIAVQDGREIATLAQPCEGDEWVITPPD